MFPAFSSVVIPTLSTNWKLEIDSTGLDDGDIYFPGTPRKPEMINVPDHSNTLLLNMTLGSSAVADVYHPITGIINPEFSYRYSFYYRAKLGNANHTKIEVTPYIQYFKMNDVDGSFPISTSTYPATTLESGLTSTERTDFNLFQLAIPRLGLQIPSNAKQMRVVLKFELTAAGESGVSALDFCYPVLEHAMGISAAQGYVFVPYAPSNISISPKYPTLKKRSEINTPLVFDTTRIYNGHPGRKLYDVDMEFSVIDSTYVYQLRVLENLNKMGYKIALRPKHPNLPPVMIGDLDINTSNPTYDYNTNNVGVTFIETD